MSVKILVNGSTAYDVLLGYDGSFADAIDPSALDALSVSFFAPHYARHHGGTGANIAWNLNLLGIDPMLVTTIGTDGGDYRTLLEDRGISVEHVEQLTSGATATAIIGTDSSERQITFFHPGADAHGSFPDLSEEREDISHAIISPRNAVLMMEGVRWCDKYKVPYLFDPGQQVIALSDDELRFGTEHSAGVIANEYEWGLISSRLNITEENALLKTQMVIVTQGESGVTCFCEEGALNIGPCTPDQVVNPTGAGDAFRAGLLAGMQADWSRIDTLRLGNALGSLAVEIEGTLIDHVDCDAVWSRAEIAYGEKLPNLS
ncbi:MAG: PfkB family carbohydrate kinase [Candidatus Peribacteraceae bacterium]|jgi:adenosine kinase|nr:PfkB family carbohydrate kinase [Candidatus Peribacteraceae bacterium]